MSSVAFCQAAKCLDLMVEEWPPRSGQFRRVCGITGRIPGNMIGCPLEVSE